MQLKLSFILLLWMHSTTLLLNLVTAAAAIDAEIHSSGIELSSNSSHTVNEILNIDEDDIDADTEVVEAQILPIENDATQTALSSRQGRQFFFHPGVGFLPSYTEGAKCITTHGLTGVCVSFGSCHHYVRFRRQLMFIPVRQWPPIATLNQEFCTFYDGLGRANNGICCTNQLEDGAFGFGLLPVQPMRPPATVPVPPPPPASAEVPQSEGDDNDETGEDSVEMLDNNNNDSDEVTAAKPDKFDGNTEQQATAEAESNASDNSPDFPDINNVAYDPINEEGDEAPTPVTYDDYRYQWPTQQFTGVSQAWPPALPTHPPTVAASWPPPIPTHPPGHHYPTHPPTQTRPTTPTATTKKTTTTTTTTSRRPSTTHRPNYPNYPVYPSYPSYPSYRPTTPRPKTTTVGTTRKPTTSGGTSSHGLPLECGIKNPVSPDQERIVGGSNASPNEFPWIAVLFKAGKQFCGGSLITKSHILTAAHCVARMTSWDVASLTAHLGDYDIRSSFETKHVERHIKRLVRHKGFEFSTLHNDIAILTVHEPVKFTYEIQPICLPTSNEQLSRSYSGKVATVAGWGSLRENGPQPSILQKVDIPIWPNSECARKYGSAAPGGIISSMICAGRAARDSCSGDSGGPMIINEGGRYTQVGIVSWGIGCGKGQYPGVYTRVTSLLPWIYKNIKS